MSHHIIEAHELSFAYPDGLQALCRINFRITHGESVGIVGANGAGKSTLLLIIAGVWLPTEGTLKIGDVPLSKNTVRRIRRSVGLVFQEPDDQLFMPTVFEDVAFGPANLGIPRDQIEGIVKRALREVGAEHLASRPPYKLSGGEKRSASIATVLSMGTDILVMDEPTSSLDPAARRKLIDILSRFSHTKIIASHDLDMILDTCERTIVLDNGSILADGPTIEVFTDEHTLERAHLEKPLRMQACPICSRGRRSDSCSVVDKE